MSRNAEDYCRLCTHTVHLVQGKWKMHILCAIRSGPVRLGQLRRALGQASKKVLTENLRELEEAGLVIRRDYGGSVRHVESDFSDSVRIQRSRCTQCWITGSLSRLRPDVWRPFVICNEHFETGGPSVKPHPNLVARARIGPNRGFQAPRSIRLASCAGSRDSCGEFWPPPKRTSSRHRKATSRTHRDAEPPYRNLPEFRPGSPPGSESRSRLNPHGWQPPGRVDRRNRAEPTIR